MTFQSKQKCVNVIISASSLTTYLKGTSKPIKMMRQAKQANETVDNHWQTGQTAVATRYKLACLERQVLC